MPPPKVESARRDSSAGVRHVVDAVHEERASTMVKPKGGKQKGGKQTPKAAAAEPDEPWGVDEYKALIEASYSGEQPFAPGFNPLLLGSTSRSAHNMRKRENRTDTLAFVNCRFVHPVHAAVLIPILELFLARAQVKPEELWANRDKVTTEGRKRKKKIGTGEAQRRYWRGDAILILKTFFRYIREELQVFDCQFFFPDTRLLYKFTRECRKQLEGLGYPKLSMTGLQRILIQFDAIALYHPYDNSRYGIARTDSLVKSPENLFNAVMHWDDLAKESQELLEAVTTKTAAEKPYQPLLAKVVALVKRIDNRIDVTLTGRLEDALRNSDDVDSIISETRSLSDDDDDGSDILSDESEEPRAKQHRSGNVQAPLLHGSPQSDSGTDVLVLKKGQATLDADLRLPWVHFSDGSTEAPERTIERVRSNLTYGAADKDLCGIVGGDGSRHGISPVLGASNKVPHLMQAVSARVAQLLDREVDVQPIFIAHSPYVGPICPSEAGNKLSREVVDVGDGTRVYVIVLCRDGHNPTCANRYIALGIFVPCFINESEAETMLDFLSTDLFHSCLDTQARWMLAPNMVDLCPCEGKADEEDPQSSRCAHVKLYWCIGRMDRSIKPAVRRCHLFNSTDSAKMVFGTNEVETDPTYIAQAQEIMGRLDRIADTLEPVLKVLSPGAYQNQMMFSSIASSCRIGTQPQRSPFASMAIGFDATEHFRTNNNEMTNGASVKLFLVDSEIGREMQKRRGRASAAGHLSDQTLVFPELVVRKAPNRADGGSWRPGLTLPILNGAVFIAPLSHIYNGTSGVIKHVSSYVGTAVVTLGQGGCLNVQNHGQE